MKPWLPPRIPRSGAIASSPASVRSSDAGAYVALRVVQLEMIRDPRQTADKPVLEKWHPHLEGIGPAGTIHHGAHASLQVRPEEIFGRREIGIRFSGRMLKMLPA